VLASPGYGPLILIDVFGVVPPVATDAVAEALPVARVAVAGVVPVVCVDVVERVPVVGAAEALVDGAAEDVVGTDDAPGAVDAVGAVEATGAVEAAGALVAVDALLPQAVRTKVKASTTEKNAIGRASGLDLRVDTIVSFADVKRTGVDKSPSYRYSMRRTIPVPTRACRLGLARHCADPIDRKVSQCV